MKDNWLKELQRKVEMDGEKDCLYSGGVYDMAREIVLDIESIMGNWFDDKIVDEIIESVYKKIKYGE